MTCTHWLILAAFAIVATITGCAAIEVQTPYGSVGYDGKTVRLKYSGK